MYQKLLLILFLFLFITSCAKKDEVSVKPPDEKESYNIYKEGLEAMNKGEFFLQLKNFLKQKKSYL